jgi:protein-S-isoprenylcysteine O-methyltransferase Ste14
MRYARIALLSVTATYLLPFTTPAIAQAKTAAGRGARQKIPGKDLGAYLVMTPFVAPAVPRAPPRAKGTNRIVSMLIISLIACLMLCADHALLA